MIGDDAEELVASYLVANGFKIIAKNFRSRNCEIDLIVSKEESLIFIEVKTCSRANSDFFSNKVNKRKQEKLITCAKLFCVKNFKDLCKIKSIRFDVIFVDLKRGDINHYEGAFFAENELISF